MQNIDTTFFRSEQQDSICLFQQPETDTIQICSPVRQYFSQTPLNNTQDHTGNAVIFTIIFLIIFAIVRLKGRDTLLNMLSLLIKRKRTEIMLSDGVASNLTCYLLSLLLSFASLATIVTYFISQEFFNLYSLYIFGGLWTYHLFMLGLISLLGWTFNDKHAAAEGVINLWTYHIMAGLLISPLVIAVFFVKTFAVELLTKIIIGYLILLLVLKIIRWIEILFVHRILISYMILYLCALEIIPILILYKIAV